MMYRSHDWSPSIAWAATFCSAVLLLLSPDPVLAQERLEAATVRLSSAGVSFQPVAQADGWVLTVTGPDGFYFRQEFEGETPSFSLAKMGRRAVADGQYNYELTATQQLDEGTRRRLQAVRESGDPSAMETVMAEMRRRGELPEPQIISGSFRVIGGSIVTDINRAEVSMTPRGVQDDTTIRDVVYLDDVIIDGSLCVGFDCVNGESFGFDTIRLKENNLRIHFQDTSTAAGFPTNDWRIRINSQANGGNSEFVIEDSDAGRDPFTIRAGAPSNSIYVDPQGDVGFGTLNPVLEVHTKDGDTPSLRLEQDGSSGFQAQTWDVAGNETNFFIRDATGGSRLPFRIRPGAPTSSIDIASNGRVGFGTGYPEEPLHLTRSDGTAKALFEETSGTSVGRSLLVLRNNGRVFLNYEDTDSGNTWQTSGKSTFRISLAGSASNEFDLSRSGDLTISGDMNATAFNVTSSRTVKEGFAPISSREMLERLLRLPVSEWSFIGDETGARHVGPVAEDFNNLFGLGDDFDRISLNDATGVAFSSIQGLYELLQEKETQIDQLFELLQQRNEQIDDLSARIAALERALQEVIKR